MSKNGNKGIAIIVIFYILVAVAFFILGIVNFIPSNTYLTTFGGELWLDYAVDLPIIGSYLDTLGNYILPYPNITIIAVVLIILGVIMALDAIGLLKRKKWAHSLAVLIGIMAIVVIIGIILVWYLLKSEIKTEFGKI
jgi:lysylphosphatidylglycerol synthetase-like protein (DUF2156 family)